MKVNVAVFLSLIAVLSTQAGVYDDTAAWWHLDYDPDHIPAATNAAQISDIRDQRNWTATSGATVPSAIGGEYGGPLWTNAPVVCPAGGRAYGMSLWFPQITNEQVIGTSVTNAIKVDAIQFSNLKLGGSSTIVTRFLWDGRWFGSDQPDWIYNNSLDWNNRRGWMFGVRHDGGHRLGMWVGQTPFYLDNDVVPANTWCDAAAVITDNGTNDTVELFLWPAGKNLLYKKMTTSVVTNAVGGNGGIIGCEASPAAGYQQVTDGNASKCFKGLLNHLALWGRALSYDEVLEAFCFPQPLIQVGLDNGNITELREEGAIGAVWNAADPWHMMPRAVSASRPDVTLNIPLTAAQAGLNYLFHLKTHQNEGDRDAKLLLSVNGQSDPTRETLRVGSRQDVYWPVAKERLVAGTNTFTLTRAAGPAVWTTFDFIELGGAWQLGLDGNATADFSQENAANLQVYATETDWSHQVGRAITYGNPNFVLHFNLTSQMVATAKGFTYTTRIVGQGGGSDTGYSPPYPFSVGVNGSVKLASPGVPDNTLVAVPISPNELRAGDNTVNVIYGASNGWIQFDFHRLDTTPWQLPDLSGTLLYLR
jgi:hypothetical protein